MKSFFKKMAPGFFSSLIILIIGIYINSNREKKSTQKRYIDCFEKVVFNGLDSAELKEQGVEILHNGKAMFGFSDINVQLYNFSDKDDGNIKVLIEIIPKKGDSLEMVDPKVFGPHRLATGIKKTNDNTGNAGKGSFKLEYLIETANRADSINDFIFNANYGVISKEEPTLKVVIQGIGLNKVSYNREHYQKLSWWERDDNAFLCFFIAGILVFFVTFVKTILYIDKKRNERWKLYLLKNLTEKINAGKVNYDAESIIKVYRNIGEQFDYDDASVIMRRIKKMKPPEENV